MSITCGVRVREGGGVICRCIEGYPTSGGKEVLLCSIQLQGKCSIVTVPIPHHIQVGVVALCVGLCVLEPFLSPCSVGWVFGVSLEVCELVG